MSKRDWALTMDATYPSTRGEIFNAFSANQHVGIWDRLQLIDCLIPYLHTLFKDINYLQVLVHCLKWLISISLNNTISMALKRAFLKKGSSTPNLIDQCDFGIRELYAYAMRHFLTCQERLTPKTPWPSRQLQLTEWFFGRLLNLPANWGSLSPQKLLN